MYELTITYTSGYSDIGTCDTFADLRRAIDAAKAAPGFVRYVVRPRVTANGQHEATQRTMDRSLPGRARQPEIGRDVLH